MVSAPARLRAQHAERRRPRARRLQVRRDRRRARRLRPRADDAPVLPLDVRARLRRGRELDLASAEELARSAAAPLATRCASACSRRARRPNGSRAAACTTRWCRTRRSTVTPTSIPARSSRTSCSPASSMRRFSGARSRATSRRARSRRRSPSCRCAPSPAFSSSSRWRPACASASARRARELEELMARTAAETAALFAEYHIPVVEGPAERVYVTNEDAGTVSIISTATHSVIGEVEVGTRPRGVEVSARRRAALRRAVGLAEMPADAARRGVREARGRQDARTASPSSTCGRARCCACCRAARIPKSSTSTPRRPPVRFERGRGRAIDRRPRDRRSRADGRRRRRARRRAAAARSARPSTSRARATTP